MNYKKNIKIFLVLTLLLGLLGFIKTFCVHIPTINAQEEIIDNSKTATTSESIKDLKKIIVDNIESKKVQGAIDNLLNRKAAMIGRVTRVTDDAITIDNISGTKILSVDGDQKITKNGKNISVDEIEVGNWAMILGQLENDKFSPHFIFIYSKTLRPKTQVVMLGTISNINSNEVTIAPRSGDKEVTLKLANNTNYQDSDGTEIKLSNFSKDINVLVTGFEDDKNMTAATLKSLAQLTNE